VKNSKKVAVEVVANAMGKTKLQFIAMHPALMALGFPDLENAEADIDVGRLLDWLVHQQESCLAVVTMLVARLDAPEN
jgi:hypothetical protein